ncbi:hypothetical protein BJ508DRAFT_304929 [Ascobolus immersus RN42]|uniref:Uncharacterized protein n=1 Tax=Ascobolus immersus RN42 TaxID=1160509 RepID=A0A3N4IG86_ASCIM|nr:hypothetical protein BJ508DRAFT_304929 [Ascobolus immersus RN42]
MLNPFRLAVLLLCCPFLSFLIAAPVHHNFTDGYQQVYRFDTEVQKESKSIDGLLTKENFPQPFKLTAFTSGSFSSIMKRLGRANASKKIDILPSNQPSKPPNPTPTQEKPSKISTQAPSQSPPASKPAKNPKNEKFKTKGCRRSSTSKDCKADSHSSSKPAHNCPTGRAWRHISRTLSFIGIAGKDRTKVERTLSICWEPEQDWERNSMPEKVDTYHPATAKLLAKMPPAMANQISSTEEMTAFSAVQSWSERNSMEEAMLEDALIAGGVAAELSRAHDKEKTRFYFKVAGATHRTTKADHKGTAFHPEFPHLTVTFGATEAKRTPDRMHAYIQQNAEVRSADTWITEIRPTTKLALIRKGNTWLSNQSKARNGKDPQNLKAFIEL